jgi:RNA polymerase sigma-70 factor (ECF subfamily)
MSRKYNDDVGRKKMSVDCHKTISAGVLVDVEAAGEALERLKTDENVSDLERIFKAQYERIARVIAGVIRDRARAEELAVDVFLKWSHTPKAQGEQAEGWLYRAAVRVGLNELRREVRRNRYEALFGFLNLGRKSPTPEEIRAEKEEHERVRLVLSAMRPRQAELLILRSNGFSYEELASMLSLNSASVGTLLSRAELAFRKAYINRYGKK